MKIRVALYCSQYHFIPYTYLYTDVTLEDEAEKLKKSLKEFSDSSYGDNMLYFYFGGMGLSARDKELKKLLSNLEIFTKLKFSLKNEDKDTDQDLSLTVT